MDKEYEIYFPDNIQPECEFQQDNKYRYCLEITNDTCDDNRTLVALLMNPSKAGLNSSIFKDVCISDETVNLIIQAFYTTYRKIIIFNIFPVINSSSQDAEQYYSRHANENMDHIREYVEGKSERSYDLLVATGHFPRRYYNNYCDIMDLLSSKARMIRGRKLVKTGYAEHVNPPKGMSNNLNILIKNLIEYSWENHKLIPETIN